MFAHQRRTPKLMNNNRGKCSSGSNSSSIVEKCTKNKICLALLALVFLLLLVQASKLHNGHGKAAHKNRRLMSSGSESGSIVSLACKATRYPSYCISKLSQDSRSASATPEQLIGISIGIASTTSAQSLKLTTRLRGKANGDQNLTAASSDCIQVLGFATPRFQQCSSALINVSNFSKRAVKDAEAWLSAALSYQYDCFSALGYVNSSKEVQQIMVQVDSGITEISNSLSMLDAFDLYGRDPVNWKPPPTKRSNVSSSTLGTSPYWMSHRDRGLLQVHSGVLKKNLHAVVSKDGLWGLRSVQQAIDDAPENSNERYIIHVKEGVYDERVVVPATKTMVMLVGDGVDKTVITGKQYVHPGVTTMETATMLVVGDGFLARDLTIENTGGPEVHQAVALRVDADQAAFQACSFKGYQDTLYAHTLRHYYGNCTISGTVDFIFGNAASVFENCSIQIRPGRKGVSTSMVSAHGRIDPAQVTGFVFRNCTVDASSDFLPIVESKPKKYVTYLGRPWKLFSRSVFLECYLGAIVPPEGWMPWKGDFALDTLFFGEYKSRGPGALNLSQRVPWSTQMVASEVPSYSTQSFIQGYEWGIHSDQV